MDLRVALILRITLAALLCLCGLSGYGLLQTSRDSTRSAKDLADSIGKQLDFQLIRLATGTDYPERFPDWEVLLEASRLGGLCVRYVGERGEAMRSTCYREGSSEQSAPKWFAAAYRWALDPGHEAVRRVSYRGMDRGAVIVAVDADAELSRAWGEIRSLLRLTTIIVLTLSGLIYVSVYRALKPARQIVSVLERMERGELSARLVHFSLREFRAIGDTVNRLGRSLEESQAARQALNHRLVHVQEEERRHLARELHDEFGQCLAAINASAASVQLATGVDRDDLIAEGARIERVVAHMMSQLRGMLMRLRPAGIDELGLTRSLRGLVEDWNGRKAGIARFALQVTGSLDGMPDVVNANLFRIAQECLTNAAKHAGASEVLVRLERQTRGSAESADLSDTVDLYVIDNGTAGGSSSPAPAGIGILGIRERAAALGASLILGSPASGGFAVHVRLSVPLPLSCRLPA